jgi:hypothetical protein
MISGEVLKQRNGFLSVEAKVRPCLPQAVLL